MNHEEVKRKLLQDPKVREVYENPPLSLATARTVVERRRELGMTQEELAGMMGSSQSQVWRIESGQFNPTLKTLSKLEEVLGVRLVPSQGVDLPESLTPEEQLREWRDSGFVLISAESMRIALDSLSGTELRRVVRTLQNILDGLEADEYVEVRVRVREPAGEPTGNVELALTV